MWTLRRLRQSLRLRPVLQLQTLPLSLQTLQLPELPVLRQLHTLPPRLQSPAPAPLLPVTRSKMPQRLTISCGPGLDPGALAVTLGQDAASEDVTHQKRLLLCYSPQQQQYASLQESTTLKRLPRPTPFHERLHCHNGVFRCFHEAGD